jgi:hypothetical protein
MSTTEEISGITITDFEFGILSKNELGIYYVSTKTTNIPNIPGLFFGFIFNYSNNTGKTVEHRWEMILPNPPEMAKTIDGSTDVESITSDNRVVSHTYGLDTDTYAQYSINRIDPGDPSGEWLMEIYIGDRLYKTFTFNVI